ncbi:MAG: isocitrate/isopropylmalate family dehydrogenase, partial [Actinomycetota bacterium]
MQRTVTVVAGQHPAAVTTARRVLDAAGADVIWNEVPAAAPDGAGWGAFLDAFRASGVGIVGPLGSAATIALRRDLDLFAGVRPRRTIPGVPSRYPAIDLVVVRENTEGLYVDIEFPSGDPATADLVRFVAQATGRTIRPDAGLSLKANSIGASERIARFAFAWAERTGRRSVTCGHKANIMKFSDGLFLEAARRAASSFPGVAFEERIIDALTMQLVQRPEAFDVLLLPNLFGDLVAELASGLVGGAGLAPSADVGDEVAVFGASGAWGDAAGGTEVALTLAGGMLLRHIGQEPAAARVEAAVGRALAGG